MAELDEGTFELDGLLMGLGTPYKVQTIRFRGTPEIRVTDRPKGLRDGLEVGPDLMGGREIAGRIQVAEGSPATTLAVWEALAQKFTPGVSRLLRLRPTGYPETRRCTVVSRQLLEEPLAGRRIMESPFVLMAADPLVYIDAEQSASTGLGSTSGGLGFPHGFPHGFGTTTPGGITAINSGNHSVFPSGRITADSGGATNLIIEHVGRGERLTYSASLADGEFLDIDFENETVMLNGTASRFSSLTTFDFFPLDPGSNEIQFLGSGQATLQLTWRSSSAT